MVFRREQYIRYRKLSVLFTLRSSLSLILYSSLYLFTRLYPSPPSRTTTLLRLVRDNDSGATPYSREYTRIGGGWLVLFSGWRVSRS